MHLLIILVWLAVLVFEANGGRADSVETGGGFDFPNALRQLKALVGALSKPYLILTALAVVGGAYLFLHGKRERKGKEGLPGGEEQIPETERNGSGSGRQPFRRTPGEPARRNAAGKESAGILRVCLFLLANAVLLTVYLLILNAEVGYMSRIDATWGIWFWCVLFTDAAVTGTLADIRGGQKWILPILAVSIVLAILPDGRYMASTADPEGGEHSAAVSRYLCEQVISAAESPEQAGDLIIPDYRGTDLEWAVSDGIGTNIADTLYGFGIINDRPVLHVAYNAELNH